MDKQDKQKFDESLDWDTKDAGPENMKVIPVNFATEHKQMLSHLQVMVTNKYLVIPEEHDKLIISLRTAYAKELKLDKEQTSYDDLLDALRLSLKGYEIRCLLHMTKEQLGTRRWRSRAFDFF